MGDISREPLPGGPRQRGPAGKGPAEVIRLDDLTVEERMTPSEPDLRGPAEPDDPAARPFPSPRLAPVAPLRIEPFAPRAVVVPDVAGDDVAEPAAVEQAVVEQAVVEPAAVEAPQCAPERAADEDLAAESFADDTFPDADDGDVDFAAAEDADEPEEAANPPQPAAGNTLESEPESDDAAPLSEPAEIARVLLGVLLCAREPLATARLAEICNCSPKALGQGLDALAKLLLDHGLPLELLWAGDALRLATAPVVYPYLTRLKKLRKAERLSPAALETLAVIAYRQPAIRAEIEAIRGVKVGPMLKSLLEHKLVKVVGRADVPGRPLQYGTTQTFLDRFGLRTLKDLPSVQEFRTLG